MHRRYKEVDVKKGKRCCREKKRVDNPRGESTLVGLVVGFRTEREEDSVRFQEKSRRADQPEAERATRHHNSEFRS
jgi:hypothetical protein